MTEYATSELGSVVAVFNDHKQAEIAVRKLAGAGIEMKIISASSARAITPTRKSSGSTVPATE